MEFVAYVYDAWAYEQANQEASGLPVLNFAETLLTKYSVNSPFESLTAIKWKSYLLPAIAIASLSSLGCDFGCTVEASHVLEPSVNVAPWCENLYLCNTNYVLEVQTLLANRGYVVGEIDGVYGRHTKQAIMDFQKSQNNLVVDGIPGERTLTLLRASNTANNLTNKVTNQTNGQINGLDRPRQIIIVRDNFQNNNTQPTTIYGSEVVSEVSEAGNLQLLLQQRGFYEGQVDGQQGQATKDAVLKAQQAYGMVSDGFAGPLTIRALLAGGNNISLTQPPFNRSPPPQDVFVAQQLLKDRGFYDQELNGLYDIRTRASILKAQRAYAQPSTGELSSNLLVALKAQTESPSKSEGNTQDAQLNSNNLNPNNQNMPSSSNGITNTQPINNPQAPSSQAPSSSQNLPIPTPKSSNL
jgi:peptidoglycan hydrolase-like protein with peptidoglycan-binding domain